jgi:hypothetical protein
MAEDIRGLLAARRRNCLSSSPTKDPIGRNDMTIRTVRFIILLPLLVICIWLKPVIRMHLKKKEDTYLNRQWKKHVDEFTLKNLWKIR